MDRETGLRPLTAFAGALPKETGGRIEVLTNLPMMVSGHVMQHFGDGTDRRLDGSLATFEARGRRWRAEAGGAGAPPGREVKRWGNWRAMGVGREWLVRFRTEGLNLRITWPLER